MRLMAVEQRDQELREEISAIARCIAEELETVQTRAEIESLIHMTDLALGMALENSIKRSKISKNGANQLFYIFQLYFTQMIADTAARVRNAVRWEQTYGQTPQDAN